MNKLDRTFHWAGKFEDHENALKEYWQTTTPLQRLQTSFYLNAIAYNFVVNNPPRIDKSYFRIRKNN